VQRLINVKGEHEVIQSVINVHAPPPPQEDPKRGSIYRAVRGSFYIVRTAPNHLGSHTLST
jgi:hypothetical protein